MITTKPAAMISLLDRANHIINKLGAAIFFTCLALGLSNIPIVIANGLYSVVFPALSIGLITNAMLRWHDHFRHSPRHRLRLYDALAATFYALTASLPFVLLHFMASAQHAAMASALIVEVSMAVALVYRSIRFVGSLVLGYRALAGSSERMDHLTDAFSDLFNATLLGLMLWSTYKYAMAYSTATVFIPFAAVGLATLAASWHCLSDSTQLSIKHFFGLAPNAAAQVLPANEASSPTPPMVTISPSKPQRRPLFSQAPQTYNEANKAIIQGELKSGHALLRLAIATQKNALSDKEVTDREALDELSSLITQQNPQPEVLQTLLMDIEKSGQTVSEAVSKLYALSGTYLEKLTAAASETPLAAAS